MKRLQKIIKILTPYPKFTYGDLCYLRACKLNSRRYDPGMKRTIYAVALACLIPLAASCVESESGPSMHSSFVAELSQDSAGWSYRIREPHGAFVDSDNGYPSREAAIERINLRYQGIVVVDK